MRKTRLHVNSNRLDMDLNVETFFELYLQLVGLYAIFIGK